MTLVLNRIDDRLIHGQVVVGWGQPLDIGFIVLVDDEVACSDWEQELYRMGTPPEMQVHFCSVEKATSTLPLYASDERPGILLTGNVDAMLELVQRAGIREVNIGGIHHREGRAQKLRYVFLASDEEVQLRAMSQSGVKVTAQDVPGAREVPMADLELRKPIYEKTAAYGHFGRDPEKVGSGKNAKTFFTWERTDRVKQLLKAVK